MSTIERNLIGTAGLCLDKVLRYFFFALFIGTCVYSWRHLLRERDNRHKMTTDRQCLGVTRLYENQDDSVRFKLHLSLRAAVGGDSCSSAMHALYPHRR